MKIDFMKRVTSITLSFIAIFSFLGVLSVSAQNCPPPQTGEARLTPDWTELSCIYRNNSYSDSIGLENLTEVAGQQVIWLRLDSIGPIHPNDTLDNIAQHSGKPDGLNYSAISGTPQWQAGATGCLELSGTTSDQPGNYQLGIWVTINTQALGEISGEANQLAEQFGASVDFSYYLKVREPGGTCDSVYNPTGVAESVDVSANLSASVRPNPFTHSSQLNVYTENPSTYELTIHNTLGEEVRNRSVDLNHGQNQLALQRDELPSGVYVLNLSSETGQTISKKLVIGSNR